MVEFLVGIVVILVLCAGLLEVTSITRIHTDTMVETRESAGLASLSDIEPPRPVGVDPGYIDDWLTGPSPRDPGDGKRMTRDDSYTDASAGNFNRLVVDRAVGGADGWEVMDDVPASGIRNLRNSNAPSDIFGLVYASSTADINLQDPEYSLVYRFLYKPEDGHMNVKSDAWMTWTKGIY